MQFSGKVAIVTGGTGSIGREIAALLGRQGARVLVADVSDDGSNVADLLVAQGCDAAFLRTDVSLEGDVERMVGWVMDRWQRLDVMVANAGIGGKGAADELTLSNWQRVMDVNLTSVFLCIKHAVPAMRLNGGGSIVSTASVMGLVGPAGAVSYAATKGAIVNLTRAAAIDYAAENIRVNAVCPGHLESPTSVGGAAARAADPRDLLARYPMRRLGKPAEVANAIAFLASDAASFITGTSLVVDGGYSAQ
jgi:NAD(P)-dependent dehydrogenase (short-subunit alcohol dehydrogenase family)